MSITIMSPVLCPCHIQTHGHCHDSSDAVVVWQVTLKYMEALIRCSDTVLAAVSAMVRTLS